MAFVFIDIFYSIQPSYLELKHNRLKSKISVWLNICNQERFQKNN